MELDMNTCTYKINSVVGNQVAKEDNELFNYVWGNYAFHILLTIPIVWKIGSAI